MAVEVQDVTVVIPTDDVALPVGHDGPITLGGLTAHAATERTVEARDGRPAIQVAVMPGEWQGDRRLLYPGHVFTEDRRHGHSMSMAIGRPVTLTCPDPTGDAPTVTLTSALIHVRGPWRLEIPLA